MQLISVYSFVAPPFLSNIALLGNIGLNNTVLDKTAARAAKRPSRLVTKLFYAVAFYTLIAACIVPTANAHSPALATPSEPHTQLHTQKSLPYDILEEAPHDRSHFTQGWILEDKVFIESSGLYGRSYIIKYDQNNITQAKYKLPNFIFAEGLASNGKDLILLTWKKQLALKLDQATLKPIESIAVKGEGWGLTHTGQYWAMSNGSDHILLRDNNSFDVIKKLSVQGFNRQWQNINELEYAEGLIWANIWQEPFIIAINPDTGVVQKKYDLRGIVVKNTQSPQHETLNGIAYDAQKKAFWITGKFWSKRYLIRFK